MDEGARGSRDHELNAALLDAHRRGDHAAMIVLYSEAADRAEADRDVDAACFYLTHAYIFALQSGSDRTDGLHAQLCAYGREA